jgi:hypothetical protein
MNNPSQLSSLTVKQLKDKLTFLRNQVKNLAGNNPSAPDVRREHSRTLNAVIDEIELYEAELTRRPHA